MPDEDTRQLRRSFCDGPSAAAGFADDYACMISAWRERAARLRCSCNQLTRARVVASAGLIELYEARGDVAHLRWALSLFDTLFERFWDAAPGGGAYFAAPPGDARILLRLKEDYDGAEPSASAKAAEAAFRLAALFSHDGADGAAQRQRLGGLVEQGEGGRREAEEEEEMRDEL